MVYGKTAVTCSLNLGCFLQVTNENDDCFSIDSPDFGVHESISLTKLQAELLPYILPCDDIDSLSGLS